jgi:hypothetical protein
MKEGTNYLRSEMLQARREDSYGSSMYNQLGNEQHSWTRKLVGAILGGSWIYQNSFSSMIWKRVFPATTV